MTDTSFFNFEETLNRAGTRHGVYAFSRKDWENIREKCEQEEDKAAHAKMMDQQGNTKRGISAVSAQLQSNNDMKLTDRKPKMV